MVKLLGLEIRDSLSTPEAIALISGILGSFLSSSFFVVFFVGYAFPSHNIVSELGWMPFIATGYICLINLMHLLAARNHPHPYVLLLCMSCNAIGCLRHALSAIGFVPSFYFQSNHSFQPVRYIEWMFTTSITVFISISLFSHSSLNILLPNHKPFIMPISLRWILLHECFFLAVALLLIYIRASLFIIALVPILLLWMYNLIQMDQVFGIWLSVFTKSPSGTEHPAHTVSRQAFYLMIRQVVSMLKWVRLASILMWLGFPSMWIMNLLSMPQSTQEKVFFITDVISKSLLTEVLHLMHDNVLNEAQRVNEALDTAAKRELDENERMKEHSRQEAAMSLESKTKFLRYVFHEVRIPLNSLSLSVQVLDAERTQEEKQILKTMKVCVSHMSRLLNDVLSWQKMENGVFDSVLHLFNLPASIRRTVMMMQPALKEKGLSVMFELENADLPVFADKYRIQQILANLLSNAIKYSPSHASIQVKLQLIHDPHIPEQKQHIPSDLPPPPVFSERSSPSSSASSSSLLWSSPTASSDDGGDEQWIKISVTDYGAGLTLEQQKVLFKPFSQVRPGELADRRGTGLGLAICKRIVEYFGGRIYVVSVPNVVTTFSYELPVRCSSLLPTHTEADEAEVYDFNDELMACDRFPTFDSPLPSSFIRRGSSSDTSLSEHTPSAFTPCGSTTASDGQDIHALDRASTRSVSCANASLSNQRISASTPPGLKRRLAATEQNAIVALIVDDVSSNRLLLAKLLERAGFIVLFADDGAVAVQVYHQEKERINVILMDHEMPIMNGFEATRVIRRDGFSGPIIGITANSLPGDRSAFMEAGLDDIFVKPVSIPRLINTIKELLNRKTYSYRQIREGRSTTS